MARALEDEDRGAVIFRNAINNLKFADDIGLLTESPEVLQLMLSRTDTESKRFGLSINEAKTETECISSGKNPLKITIGERP